MIIKPHNPSDPLASEITPHSLYLKRRQFIGQGAALAFAASALPVQALQSREDPGSSGSPWLREQIGSARETAFGEDGKYG